MTPQPSPEIATPPSQFTVTKDTTLRLSWGALLAIVIYVGGASWWLSEIRSTDRELMKNIDKELTRQIEVIRVDHMRKTDTITSDLSYTAKTVVGYASRFDRLDEALRELSLVRHRLEKSEHSGENQDKRMAAHEAGLEEVRRKLAEDAVIIDYLLKWLNPPGTEPFKRRNENTPIIDDEQRVETAKK